MRTHQASFTVVVVLLVWLFDFSFASAQQRMGVQRFKYEASGASRYLVVEILDDDLAHFELSEVRTASEPSPQKTIPITPMVDGESYLQYPGPTGQDFSRHDNVVETREMTVFIEDDARCIRVFDKSP